MDTRLESGIWDIISSSEVESYAISRQQELLACKLNLALIGLEFDQVLLGPRYHAQEEGGGRRPRAALELIGSLGAIGMYSSAKTGTGTQ